MALIKVDRTPENTNFLSPRGFQFIVHRAPHLVFFVQGVNIPSISLPPVPTGTPFSVLPYHGDSIEYGELTVKFKIDEDMRNYTEMFNWVTGLGFPETWQQHGELEQKDMQGDAGYGKYSDLSLIMRTSLNNYNFHFTFVDAMPMEISPIEFQYNVGDIVYQDASVTFKYQRFTIDRMTEII